MSLFKGPCTMLTVVTVYNAFTRYGQSSSWCKSHALNFRAMSRVVSIRSQLKKYMMRFDLPLQSCEGDARRLRQCLVSGYWRNVARWAADGTYRLVRSNQVSCHSLHSVMHLLSLPRSCIFIQHLCCLPESLDQDGWSSMSWKRPRKLSMRFTKHKQLTC
jgi:hypothetical protein